MGAVSSGDKGKRTAARPSVLLYGLLAAVLVVCVIAVLFRSRASTDSGEVRVSGQAESSESAITDSETVPKQTVAPVGESNGENIEENEAFSTRRYRLRHKMRRKKLMEQKGPKLDSPNP